MQAVWTALAPLKVRSFGGPVGVKLANSNFVRGSQSVLISSRAITSQFACQCIYGRLLQKAH